MSFNESDIRWTDYTWNPVHGCSKTSEGCANCYAERVSRRFGHTEHPWTGEHAEENVQLKREMLEDRLPRPGWVFVNSMSDLYHPQVSDAFIESVFDACGDMRRSAFQVLTKHAPDTQRDTPHPPDNVMLGVSVESSQRTYRLDWLRNAPAATRFVSFEPLVEDIAATGGVPDLEAVDWAIIGGESGAERRAMDPEWARKLYWECVDQDVAVFFKQHSGRQPESDIKLDLGTGWGPQRIEEFPVLPHDIVSAPKQFRGEVNA